MSIAVGLRSVLAAAIFMFALAHELPAEDSTVIGQASKANGTPAGIKLLKIEPVKGYVGDFFTIDADGLPAGKKVEFFWRTVDATYITKVLTDNVEYHER